MKNHKILSLVIGLCILLIIAAVMIVKGTFLLFGNLLNTILGIAVLIGLAAVVIFMFAYAKRKSK